MLSNVVFDYLNSELFVFLWIKQMTRCESTI